MYNSPLCKKGLEKRSDIGSDYLFDHGILQSEANKSAVEKPEKEAISDTFHPTVI